MSKQAWNSNDIPDQKGKTIIITGASSGLGKEATQVLLSKNAKVIMAVRNTEKAEKVAAEIRAAEPNGTLEIKALDLSSLKSIQAFSEGIIAEYPQLDTLINNAGIMMCPFSKTADGFEIQMGTNHLGHFALTGHLLPLLKKTTNSRIVVTSSIAHKSGDIDFNDINWESRKYKTTKAYSDSKLANLYFALELSRKLEGQKDAPKVVSAHPGWTKTNLDRHSGLAAFLGNIVAQKVDRGTLPSLRAATDQTAKSGDYFGPHKNDGNARNPVLVQPNKMAQNQKKAAQLWEISETLTHVKYSL